MDLARPLHNHKVLDFHHLQKILADGPISEVGGSKTLHQDSNTQRFVEAVLDSDEHWIHRQTVDSEAGVAGSDASEDQSMNGLGDMAGALADLTVGVRDAIFTLIRTTLNTSGNLDHQSE